MPFVVAGGVFFHQLALPAKATDSTDDEGYPFGPDAQPNGSFFLRAHQPASCDPTP